MTLLPSTCYRRLADIDFLGCFWLRKSLPCGLGTLGGAAGPPLAPELADTGRPLCLHSPGSPVGQGQLPMPSPFPRPFPPHALSLSKTLALGHCPVAAEEDSGGVDISSHQIPSRGSGLKGSSSALLSCAWSDSLIGLYQLA